MHHALAVILSIFFFSAAHALYFPQFRLSPFTKATHPELAEKCTFTAYHKQIHQAGSKKDYIQINEIIDHPNDMTIDIAALRPATARNSYVKISDDQAYAIEGLLDDKSLVTHQGHDEDEVLFEVDGVWFSTDSTKNGKSAYCVTGSWDFEIRNGDVGSRCAFPCEAIGDEDEAAFSTELR
ncbi:hypothetical protein FB567DRAFT_447195 [Paraphoma chrysanthemicola]|uniref:Uncharacterized protein n=1 Tax=Paraphoma chrysanthemicola TaxID=798071 RepID=A0A8K0R1N8_9PLEO|nr:hypothetical protein FB567DRAFT_447195 [Paraphoma chrysanthemicola]